jgi:hypothetical protein
MTCSRFERGPEPESDQHDEPEQGARDEGSAPRERRRGDRADRRGGGFRFGLKDDGDFADHDLVAVDEGARIGERLVVDAGAVPALEVFDEDAGRFDLEARMQARHRRMVDPDLRFGAPARQRDAGAEGKDDVVENPVLKNELRHPKRGSAGTRFYGVRPARPRLFFPATTVGSYHQTLRAGPAAPGRDQKKSPPGLGQGRGALKSGSAERDEGYGTYSGGNQPEVFRLKSSTGSPTRGETMGRVASPQLAGSFDSARMIVTSSDGVNRTPPFVGSL